ncbi:LLM class flavin-dependent oxidoreductase [Agrobacterium sp. CNPSo 3708]|uniref:LLM class flavin-dependent oxidoreductase n=1 Tax=Agrobacterium sp. CNPSo 3708 TaxID=3028150 RepID=UPI002363BF0A|nr:LLM class flavin-dependent oxidoreductase [Agrobacterium sp. CNPSo 3708]MDD1500923.1 LLM class flavin-dependent oxidoreductase [Agrobacterium sp. CNPSo 3708]
MTENSTFAAGQFLLGTFASNCSGGMSVTKVPERWDNSWNNNLKLARLLDDAGIDFMLPIARWIGYGGETNFHGNVLETMTWAAGLLASTRNINVFATIHTAANHPAVVAKQIATIDQISNGRVGLNIVAGWNQPEYEALGLNLPANHESRYAYADEWFDVVKALWQKEEAFDYNGTFFHLKNILGDPRPSRKIPILNAAGSGQGRDFALRNADFLFTPAIDLGRSQVEIAELKAKGAEAGRNRGVLTFSHVVCRPTEKEATDYLQHFGKDNADWDAVDNLVKLQFAHAHSFPHDLLALIRDRMAAGHGGFPLVGTPQQVAEGLISLHKAGFAGTTLSFVDYAEEFPYFRDTVLPLLEQAGIRLPVAQQHAALAS